jgi:Tol biopolymer transport system component
MEKNRLWILAIVIIAVVAIGYPVFTVKANQYQLELPGTLLITSNDPGKVYLKTGRLLIALKISEDDIHLPYPSLSPSGTKIAFRDSQAMLMSYDLITQETHQYSSQLTGGSGFIRWSPNEDKIAFQCPVLPFNICMISTNSDEIDHYTGTFSNNSGTSFAGYYFAGWTNDSEKTGLLFYKELPPSEAKEYYASTLEIVDNKTKTVTKVLSNSDHKEFEDIKDAMLSPDGKAFLFSAKNGDFYTIYKVKTDGTGLQRVTSNSLKFDITHPIWSPDGKEFVAAVPQTGSTSADPIFQPMVFDLSGNIVGQINIDGGGEAVTWIK